jgi:uncharacterized protein (DUF427 family)
MSVKAVWNGVTLAESDETIVLEGNHYFPSKSLNKEYFEPSKKKSTCFWKGSASYYDINVMGRCNHSAAWYYPEPSQRAMPIKNHVAFWKGVDIISE